MARAKYSLIELGVQVGRLVSDTESEKRTHAAVHQDLNNRIDEFKKEFKYVIHGNGVVVGMKTQLDRLIIAEERRERTSRIVFRVALGSLGMLIVNIILMLFQLLALKGG